jgi:hypothetical protein
MRRGWLGGGFAGLMLAAGAACAADYLLLQADADGALLIDRASIRRDGDSAQAWTLRRFDRAVPASAGVPGHQAIRALYRIDCASRRLAVAERHYLAAGTAAAPAAANSGTPEANASPALSAPATQGERMLLATVCAR